MTRAIAMDVSCLTRMALENRSDNRTEKLQRPLFDYFFTKKSVKSSATCVLKSLGVAALVAHICGIASGIRLNTVDVRSSPIGRRCEETVKQLLL